MPSTLSSAICSSIIWLPVTSADHRKNHICAEELELTKRAWDTKEIKVSLQTLATCPQNAMRQSPPRRYKGLLATWYLYLVHRKITWINEHVPLLCWRRVLPAMSPCSWRMQACRLEMRCWCPSVTMHALAASANISACNGFRDSFELSVWKLQELYHTTTQLNHSGDWLVCMKMENSMKKN